MSCISNKLFLFFNIVNRWLNYALRSDTYKNKYSNITYKTNSHTQCNYVVCCRKFICTVKKYQYCYIIAGYRFLICIYTPPCRNMSESVFINTYLFYKLQCIFRIYSRNMIQIHSYDISII